MPPALRRALALLCGALAIAAWQAAFWRTDLQRLAEHRRRDVSGFFHDNGWRFFYFQYYLGLLPLTTPNLPDAVEYSRQGAMDQLRLHGDKLVMEDASFVRDAMSPGVFLYYPKAWLTGSARAPSLIPFNKALFVLALLALAVAAFRLRGPWLAAAAVAVFGSSPFLVYENAGTENIRGLAASTLLCALALNAFAFGRARFGPAMLAWPALTGALVAAAVQVRTELHAVSLCVLFLYVTAWRFRWRERTALVAVFCAALLATSAGCSRMLDWKFRQACAVAERAGGHPLKASRLQRHVFWHVVFCGLGDFDPSGFYRWDDLKAYRYVIPLLNRRHGLDLRRCEGKYFLENDADESGLFKERPEYVPGYAAVCREKVLRDIAADPVWYGRILFKRTVRFFAGTSPVWLAADNSRVAVPWSGWMLFPVAAVLLRRRDWDMLRLVLFSLPLGASVIAIYAENNASYSSVYHLFAFAATCQLCAEWVREKLRLRKTAGIALQ